MATLKCILGIVVLLTVLIWTEAAVLKDDSDAEDLSASDKPDKTNKNMDNDVDNVMEDGDISVSQPFGDNPEDEDELSVSERLELVNKDLERDEDILIEDGDIAVSQHQIQKRNAEPCVIKCCKWPRHNNGYVYVPYVIAQHYSSSQINVIRKAFDSFSKSTCIRFIPRTNQKDFLQIVSSTGCFSHVGRTGNAQTLSLKSKGCIYLGTIQHELLHALGFNHEHKRSDRSQHIKVLWQNIEKGHEHNFKKVRTLNLATPYDYHSVMHYSRNAFSKNGKPTLQAKPNPHVTFGDARSMSLWDITRVNRLYCN